MRWYLLAALGGAAAIVGHVGAHLARSDMTPEAVRCLEPGLFAPGLTEQCIGLPPEAYGSSAGEQWVRIGEPVGLLGFILAFGSVGLIARDRRMAAVLAEPDEDG